MKIRAKLTIVILSLIIISLVVPSVMALESFSTSLESQITNNLEEQGSRTMDKISRFLFERYGDVKVLVDPRNSIMQSSQFSISDKIEYLKAVEKAYPVYLSFSIYSINGIKLAGTHNINIGTNASNEQFFVNPTRNNSLYYDAIPTYSKDFGQYVIHFSAPLHNEKGDITGILLATVPLAGVSKILEDDIKEINNVHADLVSSNGQVIFSNYNQKTPLQQSSADLPIFSEISSSNRSSQSIVSSLKSISSGNDDQQAIFVAAKEQGFLGYKGNGWILIMAVPTEVAFKEVSQLRTNVILVAIAILASAIIAVIVFSKLVTEPLVKLKNVASEIAKGNFDVNAKVDSNDEIGELSRQFEKMKIDLRDRERLKDEFINIAAHELRSPLQPIISYNELALKGLIDKDEALKIIDIESQRFIQLANDILDVTRIEGGALTYQIQKVRLVDILERIVSSAKISSNLSNETTIELVTDEQSKGIEVDADINRLSQVFMNIIGNAVKFTRKGKIKISLSAHPAQNEIEIRIADNGGGIPKDILPHLFGKFVTRSVKGGTEHGTGLGLFISKAIVLAHGGRIYGSNNSEGGATFTIFLPIKANKNIINNNGDNET